VVLRGPASEVVHALKYQGWEGLAGFMGDRMAQRLVTDGVFDLRAPGDWAVVPVPTTERRIRERGYNQAALLAERVGAEVRIPVRAGLVRVPSGASQTSLGAEDRRENVRGVFQPGEVSVEGADVLLVDDVLTTGATAGEAASVLVDAGARSVVLLAFARALRDGASG
jgi:ComF family protein